MDLGAAIDIAYEWLESPSTSKDEENIKNAVGIFLDHLHFFIPTPYDEDD